MRLVGEDGRADDGLPEELAPFLSGLIERSRDLVVHILVWDCSILYALERQHFPAVFLQWQTPHRLRFCLDDDLPVGASHHQKIVVVDDAVAFSGGLDLTTRRWDTREHELDDPRRVDLAGAPYPPFHDVQAVVDGAAAAALGELARARWERGAGERAPPPARAIADRWPQSVTPDLTAIDVGIARTYTTTEQTPQDVREVETLFVDTINAARDAIYIETQYLTAPGIVSALVDRMQAVAGLEAVLVVPKGTHSWLERKTMQAGLLRSIEQLSTARLRDRVGLFYPEVTRGDRSLDTLVHSKVMIVDDALLRIGSANLSNRSIALDSECDLAFAAQTPAHRSAILEVRNRLLGHHCGADAAEVARSLSQTSSLLRTARSLGQGSHRLVA